MALASAYDLIYNVSGMFGALITAAMESIDCGRSITETKRGVEVS